MQVVSPTNARRCQDCHIPNSALTAHWVWQVLSIPFFKWQTLTTLQARSQFLRELLPLSSQAQEDRPANISTMPDVSSLQGMISRLNCDLCLV